MAEFTPDNESASRAEKLTSRLIDDLLEVTRSGLEPQVRREPFAEHRYSDEARGDPIGDVLDNMRQMAMEFALAQRWDGTVACIKLENGDLAPISLTEFFGGPSPAPYGTEDWIELWDRYFGGPVPFYRIWQERLKTVARGEEFVTIKVLDAGERIQHSLNSFLSYRFAGMKRWVAWIQGKDMNRSESPRWPFRRRQGEPPLPPVTHGGGLRVRVSCKTRGLRIHVSPAYFISWTYFGSPSSPVVSYVLPGRYIFAGDGPMLPKRKRDPAVFSIPADYNPELKSF